MTISHLVDILESITTANEHDTLSSVTVAASVQSHPIYSVGAQRVGIRRVRVLLVGG